MHKLFFSIILQFSSSNLSTEWQNLLCYISSLFYDCENDLAKNINVIFEFNKDNCIKKIMSITLNDRN